MMSMPTFWSSLSPSSLGQRLGRVEKSGTATSDNAFFDGCTGRVHGVFDAILLFFHFDLGRTTHADHGNTAGELRQTLLQLLAIVVRSGLVDLGADLLTRPSMSAFLPAPSTSSRSLPW